MAKNKMMSPEQRWAWILLIVGSGIWIYLSKSGAPTPPKSTAVETRVRMASTTAPEPVTAATQRLPSGDDPEWLKFKAKYGNILRAEFTADGRLISVQGGSDGIFSSDSGFSTRDMKAVRARAKEILRSAASLLRMDPDRSLDSGRVQAGEFSAQVFFEQTVDGIPVQPGGKITVDLGPEGQLLSIYSDADPGVKIENSRRLSATDARGLLSPQQALPVQGGRAVVWVKNGTGRQAYEYLVDGKQTIVDADTGEILFQRSRRSH